MDGKSFAARSTQALWAQPPPQAMEDIRPRIFSLLRRKWNRILAAASHSLRPAANPVEKTGISDSPGHKSTHRGQKSPQACPRSNAALTCRRHFFRPGTQPATYFRDADASGSPSNSKKEPHPSGWGSFLVRQMGLEPTRSRTRPSNVPVCRFQHCRTCN